MGVWGGGGVGLGMWVCLGGCGEVCLGVVWELVAVLIVPLQVWVIGMHADTGTLVASQYR